MGRVTQAVLAERIKNVHSDVKEIKELIKDDVMPKVEKNTEFRNKAAGAVAIVTVVASFCGGLIVFGLGKAWSFLGGK